MGMFDDIKEAAVNNTVKKLLIERDLKCIVAKIDDNNNLSFEYYKEPMEIVGTEVLDYARGKIKENEALKKQVQQLTEQLNILNK